MHAVSGLAGGQHKVRNFTTKLFVDLADSILDYTFILGKPIQNFFWLHLHHTDRLVFELALRILIEVKIAIVRFCLRCQDLISNQIINKLSLRNLHLVRCFDATFNMAWHLVLIEPNRALPRLLVAVEANRV